MKNDTHALFSAIEHRDTDAILRILDSGLDPDSADPSTPDWTPLLAAIEEIGIEGIGEGASIEICRLLLDRGAAPNGPLSYLRPPLHLAIYENLLAVIELLLDRGADPNLRDLEGSTPLLACAEMGHHSVARLLLSRGAAAAVNEWGGYSGVSPLGWAVLDQDCEMVDILLEGGADPLGAMELYQTPLDLSTDLLRPGEENAIHKKLLHALT